MELNPIMAYRQWRMRKEERRDIKLRHQALIYALKSFPCREPEQALRLAEIFAGYIKNGKSSITSKIDDELERPDIDWKTPLPDNPVKV